ncbi:hypothetical protein Tsubulata_038744 [Turnera subulata]|uniref:DUF674 domain-containing protein n=1 Tax=Turnera subulata TaxID=218843 RepID=A0A9Q0FNU6_9ROSI|nr:hypothetical protein Tsubulata_038744 [Turnera subulata]
MKLLIDNQRKKVLFAEAGKDCSFSDTSALLGTNNSDEGKNLNNDGTTEGGYVKLGAVTYMVMDDLTIAPMSSMTAGVSVLSSDQQGLELLKVALLSKAALTELLIDKNNKKVLFAEAGKEFVDFLIALLSLPIGTAVRLLKNKTMVGSISNVYDSLENMGETYIQSRENKDAALRPRVPTLVFESGSLLPPGIEALPPPSSDNNHKLYVCSSSYNHAYVTDKPNRACPCCNWIMSREAVRLDGLSSKKSADNNSTTTTTLGGDSKGGYVKGVITYMVMDDLSIAPMSMISGIAHLNKFGVKDFGALEEKVVQLGISEGLELLKASIGSKTALTDVFLTEKVTGHSSTGKRTN